MTSPLLSLASVVLVVAALHSVVLSVALARSRREPAAARWCLAGLTFVTGLLIANLGLAFSGLSWGNAAVAAVVNSLWLAVAPLFYGYVRSLLPGRARWEPEDVVHALPIALQLFSHAALRFAPSSRPDAVEAAAPVVGFVFVSLFALQSVIYAVIAVRLVAGFSARYRREAAGAADEKLVGLRRLTVLFSIYAGAMGINLVVLLVRGSFVLWVDYLVPLAMAALISAVGYGLLRRPEIVLPPLSLPEPPAPSSRTSASRPDTSRSPSREDRPSCREPARADGDGASIPQSRSQAQRSRVEPGRVRADRVAGARRRVRRELLRRRQRVPSRGGEGAATRSLVREPGRPVHRPRCRVQQQGVVQPGVQEADGRDALGLPVPRR
ncbi:MAG: hypothetical protein WBA11_04665 [Rubrivirga sp.]